MFHTVKELVDKSTLHKRMEIELHDVGICPLNKLKINRKLAREVALRSFKSLFRIM